MIQMSLSTKASRCKISVGAAIGNVATNSHKVPVLVFPKEAGHVGESIEQLDAIGDGLIV